MDWTAIGLVQHGLSYALTMGATLGILVLHSNEGLQISFLYLVIYIKQKLVRKIPGNLRVKLWMALYALQSHKTLLMQGSAIPGQAVLA